MRDEDDQSIYWFENIVPGLLGSKQDIAMNLGYSTAIFADDLDQDGDNDVLATFWSAGKVAWYENLGNGNWGTEQIITSEAAGAKDVYTADIDGDNVPDVLSASSLDNKIAWYKNDPPGTFGPQIIISTNATYARNVFATDLDNDGMNDVLSASFNDGKVARYMNQGNAIIGPEIIVSDSVAQTKWVYSSDIDYDGDMDILSSSLGDRYVCWYPNNFCSKSIMDAQICEGDSLWIYDTWIKTEGFYQDTLTTIFGGDSTITYNVSVNPPPDTFLINGLQEVYENRRGIYSVPFDTLLSYFWELENGTITDSAANMIEVEWGSISPGFIKAFATNNETSCSTESILEISIGPDAIDFKSHPKIKIYPNPAIDFVSIESNASPLTVEFIDKFGHLVLQSKQSTIDISILKGGSYFLKVSDVNSDILLIEKLIVIR